MPDHGLGLQKCERCGHGQCSEQLDRAGSAHIARRDEALLVQRSDRDAEQREDGQRQVPVRHLATAELVPDHQRQPAQTERKTGPLLRRHAAVRRAVAAAAP
jgi:hypothetical protein